VSARIRAVVDTNIFVSGVISPKGSPRKVLLAAKDQKFKLITSAAINEEILEVLHRPHIYKKYHLTEQIVDDICAMLYEGSLVVEGAYSLKYSSPDPKDDKFLATALEGKADYLVSGDAHLVSLGRYHEVEIVTASGFLTILRHAAT